MLIMSEKPGCSPHMVARVQDVPSARDVLVTIASHCMEPSSGGSALRPKQVLLAYMYAITPTILAGICVA
jgi:hypothetical protein